MFCKKGALRNFAKCADCFPVSFAKFLRTPFFIELVWWLLLILEANKVEVLLKFHGNLELEKKIIMYDLKTILLIVT